MSAKARAALAVAGLLPGLLPWLLTGCLQQPDLAPLVAADRRQQAGAHREVQALRAADRVDVLADPEFTPTKTLDAYAVEARRAGCVRRGQPARWASILLGVLVAIIKLGSIAKVIPGPALWAFVGLTVLSAEFEWARRLRDRVHHAMRRGVRRTDGG